MTIPSPTQALPATHNGEEMVPFLYREGRDAEYGKDGAFNLACPQCGDDSVQLDVIQLAARTGPGSVSGVVIDPVTAGARESSEAVALHGSHDEGFMLSLSYWCGLGCHGRIEFRSRRTRLIAAHRIDRPQADAIHTRNSAKEYYHTSPASARSACSATPWRKRKRTSREDPRLDLGARLAPPGPHRTEHSNVRPRPPEMDHPAPPTRREPVRACSDHRSR